MNTDTFELAPAYLEAVSTVGDTAGFCLWRSRHTDYHVGNSGNSADLEVSNYA